MYLLNCEQLTKIIFWFFLSYLQKDSSTKVTLKVSPSYSSKPYHGQVYNIAISIKTHAGKCFHLETHTWVSNSASPKNNILFILFSSKVAAECYTVTICRSIVTDSSIIQFVA